MAVIEGLFKDTPRVDMQNDLTNNVVPDLFSNKKTKVKKVVPELHKPERESLAQSILKTISPAIGQVPIKFFPDIKDAAEIQLKRALRASTPPWELENEDIPSEEMSWRELLTEPSYAMEMEAAPSPRWESLVRQGGALALLAQSAKYGVNAVRATYKIHQSDITTQLYSMKYKIQRGFGVKTPSSLQVQTPEQMMTAVKSGDLSIAQAARQYPHLKEALRVERNRPLTQPLKNPFTQQPQAPIKQPLPPTVPQVTQKLTQVAPKVTPTVPPIPAKTAPKPEVSVPLEQEAKETLEWKQNISDIIDRSVFKETVSKSIQNDGQKVIDAANKEDIEVLEKIQEKYVRDKGIDQTGSGVGPGRVSRPRPGGVAVWSAAQKAIEKISKKLPKAHKPVVKETKKFGATVKEVETLRKKYKLEDVPLDEARKWETVFKSAEKKKSEASFITKSIIKKPRVLENEEFASLVIRRAELEDIIDNAEINAGKAIDVKNPIEQARQTDISNGALDELEEVTTALRWSNREAGRALNIVKATLEKEGQQYKVSKLLQKAKLSKGQQLSSAEKSKLTELANKIKVYQERETTLQKQIEGLQENLAKADAKSNFVKTTRTIARGRNVKKLTTNRESLFNELNKLGFRVNDVVGVTYESARIISKLAVNYFESGVNDIDVIAEKITNKIPDLTKKDVYDSVGGRIKNTKKIVVSDTKKGIKDLKIQARLLGQIDDAYKGIFDKPKTRPLQIIQIRKLKQQLKLLKTNAEQTIKDEERLRKILIKIDTLNDLLTTGESGVKKPRKFDSPAIKEAKQRLSEIRRLLSTNEKIADLEKQLKTGDFKVPIKVRKVIKSADLIEAQVKLAQLRREAREQIHRLKPRTKREVFVDVVSLPRELMATADFSGVGRQGAILSALDPVATLKITAESLPSFFSQNKADEIDLRIKQHENHPIRVKAGLKIKSLDNIKFSDREEDFLSTMGEQIPIYGKVVKASNRQMVSHLNLIRVMSFDRYLKLYPNATDLELKNWADYVNIASGIGDLGAFNKVASELSIGFFSPRFSMSRIQLPFQVLRHKATPRVRKEIAKNYMKFVSLVGMTLWLAKMAGAEVELDPTSSDWLKIKIGDTRIDPWGGLQQPTRLFVLTALKTLEATGSIKLEKNIDLFNSISRFIRYKLAPVISGTLEFVHGKTAVGEEATPMQTLTGLFTPLVAEEIVDTFKSNPLLGSILAPFILLGVGVSTYTKRKKKKEYTPIGSLNPFKVEKAYAEPVFSKKALARTKRFEGWNNGEIYTDTKGHKTVGYGFKLSDKFTQDNLPKDVLSGKRALTKAEAEPIFLKRYAMAQDNAIKYIGKSTFNDLTPLRQEILTDMAYNLGLTKLKGFEDMHKALLKRDYKTAALEMIDSNWYGQTKSRARELVMHMRRGVIK